MVAESNQFYPNGGWELLGHSNICQSMLMDSLVYFSETLSQEVGVMLRLFS